MADKGWKRHERQVAEFFNTERALHGIDRVKGEVQTDVFADVQKWIGTPVFDEPTGLVIECKYSTKSSSNSNDWPCRRLSELKKEQAFGYVTLMVTKDGWVWCQLDDFLTVFVDLFVNGESLSYLLGKYEVRNINKSMSSFFEDALGQALVSVAHIEAGEYYKKAYPMVCVGSNARLPRVIGFRLKDLVVMPQC